MDVLAEGARRMAAAAVAPSASPFVMDTPNVIGLLLSALVAFISGPGGQGGSSFYVCVFCVLLKLPLAEAAGTAAFVVFAGSVASALSAMGRLNPASAKPAPLIDYDSVLVMLPPMLLGIAWGVLVNAVLAEWCLNLLLLMTWAWMVYTLTRSLIRTVRLERRRKAAAAAAEERAAAA
ncbi:hypothetical protein MNEG_9194 [Monoraphidium neglectum]|uniref:Uncharacterized protein n=1 Tax=Monoraphidium neglectum TaxID=145388 RepID=A0A0D2MDD6_9CHLO|nr:hypothetical protein MNEG_9194 [Monoraphidium neglectum]KIY98771.1 hypothetical protein MNEG_9194 [Monoraphidium neglectum]|eukprot:XP_013897791.1 hypothetical protein MNEG_9194 [Monoraphidium neglectum]